MISSDSGLEVVREQLALIEDGLIALRRELLPHNPEEFDLFSEGHVAMIRKLRAEIDTYLGLSAVLPIASAAANDPVAIV